MLLQEAHSITAQPRHSPGTLETKGQVLGPERFKIFIQRIKFLLDTQHHCGSGEHKFRAILCPRMELTVEFWQK